MTTISVERDGKEIGDYDLDGIREGLLNGYFLPSDFGWYEGLSEWLPLNEIVFRLSIPPTFVAVATQAVSPSSPPLVLPPLPPVAPPPKIKQNLKPQKGEVTYVLKEAKPGRKKKKKISQIHSWEDDPATDKQIAFLKSLGARKIPDLLTKGEAHNQIDSLLNRSRGQAHSFLSPKQQACLHYYGFDLSSLNYDEAKALLDWVHENPNSFEVPEPWEIAKYRLYPKLYPNPRGRKPLGCGLLLILVFIIVCVWVVIGSHGTSSTTPTPPTSAILTSLSAPSETGASPSQAVVAPVPASDSLYHGTLDAVFAKDWVVLNKKKIDGIIIANPAPGGQVAIIYSGGGKNIPANSLPQGFLDAWKLTPERLKAADNQ